MLQTIIVNKNYIYFNIMKGNKFMNSKNPKKNDNKIDPNNIIPVYLTNIITDVKKDNKNKASSIHNTIVAKKAVDENHK